MKISSHDHFVKVVANLVQDLLSIDRTDRTVFEQQALKRLLKLLGRDESEAYH
jgi:hypothetical protein